MLAAVVDRPPPKERLRAIARERAAGRLAFFRGCLYCLLVVPTYVTAAAEDSRRKICMASVVLGHVEKIKLACIARRSVCVEADVCLKL